MSELQARVLDDELCWEHRREGSSTELRDYEVLVRGTRDLNDRGARVTALWTAQLADQGEVESATVHTVETDPYSDDGLIIRLSIMRTVYW